MKFLLKVLLCMAMLTWSFYRYIRHENDLIRLKIEIPSLQREVRRLEEKNTQLQLEIDSFESPLHLMELSQSALFSKLKYPRRAEVWLIKDRSKRD